MRAFCFVALLSIPLLPRYASDQDAAPNKASILLHPDRPAAVIDRNIYGQFTEHLGRLIYGGIWVGKDSKIPNTNGIRNDVVAALKDLSVPVVRWPGGCFADEYHWRNGIGPADQRPHRPNASWGGVDSNAFGTHEFLNFAEMIGADPYITGNLGTGTPQEMMEWLEYMTSDSDSTLANLRRQNGRDKPWRIPYFAVGNESWGGGGNMRPEYYADEFRRYATFLKNYSGNRVQKIAVGPNNDDYNWTEVVMKQAAKYMDGLTLHYYTIPSGNWQHKGSATRFTENEWHSTLMRALRIDEFIRRHSEIMDRYDPQKRIGLMVDEWGTWYDPEPGQNLGALYQQNTLRDAIVAGVSLNIINNHSDRVRMANIAQMVNVLQAMILTDNERMVRTPSYYVFRMYKVHQGATRVPLEMNTPQYTLDGTSIPALSASASRDSAGRIHLSIVNLDPNQSAEVTVTTTGPQIPNVSGEILTASAMNAMNTFDNPGVVEPHPFRDWVATGSAVTLRVPAKSVVAMELRGVNQP